jgi:predicted  nucleic acid-binding Zn-ribbon protein
LKADPAAQVRLLDLQTLDTRTDQLRHRLATLPELATIAELRVKVGDLERLRMDQQIVVDDLTVEQEKVDADVEAVKARRTRDRSRMDSGEIANPKDLERMQHELVSLDRRISSLEEQELEVMERVEEAQAELTKFTAALAEARALGSEQVASRDAKTAELNAELASIATAREPLHADLPTDLVALYEKLRAAKDGQGAALLHRGQCGGCMLTLDAAELNEIRSKADDEVVRCEECQRILVRTNESGL